MGFEIIGRARCQKESRQNFDTINGTSFYDSYIIFSCHLVAVSEVRLKQKSKKEKHKAMQSHSKSAMKKTKIALLQTAFLSS